MQLLQGAVSVDQGYELAVAHALVRRASLGALDEVLRVYRPAAPAVVFGRRDTRRPGFVAAQAAVRRMGFEPFVRATGGRVVAYTSEALVVDHVKREPDSSWGAGDRFRVYGDVFITALSSLGIDARVGAVPGEYCPGEHSVNARGTVKLIGTAQRAIRDAWLFSSLVMVDDAEVVRPVLTEVYRHLELEFDPESVGSVAGERAGTTVDDVAGAILAAYTATLPGAPLAAEIDSVTLALAAELQPLHQP